MRNETKSAVALGFFDGMHAGHRRLLRETVRIAAQSGWQSMVYTFSNHPRSVFDAAPALLSTNEEKRREMLALGMQEVYMELFDAAMARMQPTDFVTYLCEKFHVGAIVTGFNYTFGYRGTGDTALLEKLSAQHGFTLSVVPEVIVGEQTVSSSVIRSALAEGNVALAKTLLERPYSLHGKIVRNRQIGTKIGFPTANLDLADHKQLPAFGVYATYAFADGNWYPAVTNVGTNPTVSDGKTISVETNLLGFSGMIYQQELTVAFLERLRDQKRFASTTELAQQIAKDVKTAQKICENCKGDLVKIFTN